MNILKYNIQSNKDSPLVSFVEITQLNISTPVTYFLSTCAPTGHPSDLETKELFEKVGYSRTVTTLVRGRSYIEHGGAYSGEYY